MNKKLMRKHVVCTLGWHFISQPFRNEPCMLSQGNVTAPWTCPPPDLARAFFFFFQLNALTLMRFEMSFFPLLANTTSNKIYSLIVRSNLKIRFKYWVLKCRTELTFVFRHCLVSLKGHLYLLLLASSKCSQQHANKRMNKCDITKGNNASLSQQHHQTGAGFVPFCFGVLFSSSKHMGGSTEHQF